MFSERGQNGFFMIRYKLLKSQLTGTVYPQPVETVSFTQKDMERALEKRFGAVAPAVLNEAVRIICDKLAEGSNVAIDGLGTFSIRLGMRDEHAAAFEDVHTHDIRVSGVRFNAGKELRRKLEGTGIHLQKGAAVRREITAEQRWVMLYDHMLQELDRVGYATINASSYSLLTGCTGYTARRELEQLVADGKLRSIPARRVKLYTLSQELLANR